PVPVICLVLGWGLLTAPAADETVLTPEHVARLKSVSDVAVSPDGSQVAFTRSVPRRPGIDEDGEPWSELWMIDAAGGPERPFVTGKVNVQNIEWLPDGSGVAFLSKRDGDSFKSLY